MSLRPLLRAFPHALLFVLVLALLKAYDPFGLSSAGDQASASWLNRIFAGFYPETGQKEIVVIEIDDDFLIRNDTYWPLPFDEQARLFKRLLAFKPGAVFVDLMYSHEHSAAGQAQGSLLLANVFERFERQGIPLFLANTGQSRGAGGKVNTLETLAAFTRPAQVQWQGTGDRYPLAVNTPSGVRETPALLLYREHCRQTGCPDLPADAVSAQAQAPISIQWGLTLSPKQQWVGHTTPCKRDDEALDQRVRTPFSNMWTQIRQGFTWKSGDNGLAPCRYHLTLPASSLEVTDPDDRKLVSSLLEGRLVLVGANITSAGDYERSPVNGQVPGVFLHAMALDNLITYGMGYDREPSDVLIDGISWLDWLEIVLAGTTYLIQTWITRVTDREIARQALERLHLRVAAPLIAWLVVVTIIALLSWALKALHITPVNVLTIFMTSLLLLGEGLRAALKVVVHYWTQGNQGCSEQHFLHLPFLPAKQRWRRLRSLKRFWSTR
ncbi:CHASE2 domain-containing protein [Pseudomonas sp. NPDC090202]|uniref:CHASE2 domain-containing protein n=1 Tax=unclassified Pseudomonas TaxID=196821 RepID=UPI003803557C